MSATPAERLYAIVEQGLCIGCGLCQSVAPPGVIGVRRVPSGYEAPVVLGRLDHATVDTIYDVCPGTRVDGLPERLHGPGTTTDAVWGPWQRMVRTWASDPAIRHRGSTGGVLTALAVLIKNQNKDGSWSMDNGDYAIAGTSLGLMAFMVEGHFPGFGRYGAPLDRAKNYLLKRYEDSPTGAMGVKMYEIGLFTIAMSELWGMTKNPEDNREIQEALEGVVQIILRSQSPLGGWRYAPRPDAGQDTSVTAMVFVSLASAREAGILVPTETIDRLTNYLRDQAFDENRGGFGYQGKGYTVACTAGGVYAAQLAGNRETEWVEAALSSLENDPKMFSRKDNGHYYYSHYYAMQAMVQASDVRYAKWYPKIRDSLISLQQPNGSWQEKEQDYPTKPRWQSSSLERRTGTFRCIKGKDRPPILNLALTLNPNPNCTAGN